jgi:hypothetical protein
MIITIKKKVKKMAKTKYGKYIVYDAKLPIPKVAPRPTLPPGEKTGTIVLYADDTVIKRAFYLNCALIWKASDCGSPGIVHSHENYDEYVGFMGSNPEDPHDLCGEEEFWLGDEKHILTKSCAVFIPKGLLHCPIYFRRVDRPIFYFSTAPSTTYGKDLPKK